MKGLRHTAQTFASVHPESVARVLEEFAPREVAHWLGELPVEVAAGVMAKMVSDLVASVLARMEPADAAGLVQHLPPASAVGALRGCEDSHQQAVVRALPSQLASRYRALLRFPEDTAAGLADTAVFALSDDLTAGEALVRCKKSRGQAHHYLYVVDRDQHLRGVVSLMELVSAEPDAPLENLMTKEVSSLPAGESRSNVLLHAGWRKFHELPVVDEDRKFLGVVRYETLRLIEASVGRGEPSRAVAEAVKAFGNLYGVALMGLAQGVGSVLTPFGEGKRKK